MDTWYHLKGLSEASPFSDLEFNNKLIILHELNNFAWSCEISGVTVATTFWTISHDSVKFLHVHVKSACKYSLSCNTNPFSGPFCIVMRNCTIWFLSSSLVLLSFFFFWIHFNYLQLTPNPDPITLLLHQKIICPLQFHFFLLSLNASILPWNSSRTSQKSLVSLVRVTMY